MNSNAIQTFCVIDYFCLIMHAPLSVAILLRTSWNLDGEGGLRSARNRRYTYELADAGECDAIHLRAVDTKKEIHSAALIRLCVCVCE